MKESPRIITLMYHRINEADTDPWGICVSPKHFDEQLRILKNNLPVIRVEEAVQQVMNGSIPQTCACITFDDGYEDNCTNALPILKQHNCPATFFIATAFTGSSIPFWWDELEMICLHSKRLPSVLELSINNAIYNFSFERELTEKDWQAHQLWKWYEDAPTLRCRSFLSIWNLIRPLSYPLIEVIMNVIRFWSGSHYQTRLPVSAKQLYQMSSEELSTIGLHTHTHIDLASHSCNIQADDIDRNRKAIAEKYKTDGSLLAYPYGRFSNATLSAIKTMNIKACFTTEPKAITNHSDTAKLGRYQVFDWDAQQFEKELAGWISAEDKVNGQPI